MNRRVLITGAAGHLGSALCRLVPEGVELHGTQFQRPASCALTHQVDLTDEAATLAMLREVRPQLVIHTAYAATDCGRHVVQATANVARACAAVDAGLIHLSSDSVFDGLAGPYAEDAPPTPVFPYGQAKAEAEAIVREQLPDAAIVRISLILGGEPLNPSSAWIVEALREGRPVNLFVDELRTPIGVEDLAAMVWELAAMARPLWSGIWHFAGPEAVSRFALGLLLAHCFGLRTDGIVPAWSRELAVPRPRDTRLLTPRAERHLVHRPLPASAVLAGPSPECPSES